MEFPSTFLNIWVLDDGFFSCKIECLDHVDAAVTSHVNSGQDSLVNVITVGGDDVTIRASKILSWRISTYEGRLNDVKIKKLAMEEDKEMRAEVGLPFED